MSQRSSGGAAGAWPAAFLALWVGQTVSSVGSQLSLVAIPLIAVLLLHVGPLGMAILAALETAPYLILSLPAGLIADRRDRRRLMIGCDVGRAVAMATIPVVFVLGFGSFAWLCVVATVVGGLSALFTVAQQAYVPEILPPDRLVKANQRLEVSDSAARVIGPGAAGSIVQLAGGLVAVAVDALSYLVSAVAIGLAPPTGFSEPARSANGDDGGRAVVRGIEHVVRDAVLLPLVISTAVFNLASGMMLAQLVLFATQDLGVDAAGYGLFHALGNIGFLVGALLVDRLEARVGPGGVLAVAAALGAIALAMVAAAGSVVGFPLLLAGRFVGALSAPFYNVMLVTVRQARSPEHLRARVAATFRVVDWGTAPIGALLSGVIGAVAGVRAVMIVAAVVGALSVPWVLARGIRELTLDPTLPAGTRLDEAVAPMVEAAPAELRAGAG